MTPDQLATEAGMAKSIAMYIERDGYRECGFTFDNKFICIGKATTIPCADFLMSEAKFIANAINVAMRDEKPVQETMI